MKSTYRQFTCLLSAGLLYFSPVANAQSIGFADILPAHFIGTGTQNTSGLIIDFNDGAATERYAFAYKWDGSVGAVSGAQMLDAVATAIPQLSYALGSGSVADGAFLTTISYDTQSQTNEPFVFDPPSQSWSYFVAGGTAGDSVPFAAGGTPVSVVPGASSTAPDVLQPSPTGPSASGFGDLGRFIEDGSWDVWSYGDWNASTYVVPEPSSFALMGGIFALLAVSCRRRR